jgi:uncharacterized protein
MSWRSTRRARSSARSPSPPVRNPHTLSAFAALLLIHLHFPDAGSLKGKRKELSSLKAQLHGRLGVAVSEVEHQDLWQRATLAAAVTGGSQVAVLDACDRIERFLDARVPEQFRIERAVVTFQELL